MRILLVHNHYRRRGGEDIVFEAERNLLTQKGHEVCAYERRNDEIHTRTAAQKFQLVQRTVWARDAGADIRRIICEHDPQIAYFFNTFPLISPAPYTVCWEAGIPVIQTLSNYRLICVNALLQRNGKPCEECVGRAIPWPGALHGCYRASKVQSAVIAGMLGIHRTFGTWRRRVHVFIATTKFARDKLSEGGLPASRIVVKPNFFQLDSESTGTEGGFVLFSGRLSPEKGIETLLKTWRNLPEIPLRIAGDGPLRTLVEDYAERLPKGVVQVMGWQSRRDTLDLLRRANFVVVPSECYEGFPLTIVEALAHAKPVVGSQIGGIGEIIHHGESGLLFEPGSSQQLATVTRRLWHDQELRRRLGRGARTQYLANYTADRNYEQLMELFEDVIGGRVDFTET